MPPNPKYTKEEIVAAVFELVRGAVRAMAKELPKSIPISAKNDRSQRYAHSLLKQARRKLC